MGRPNFIGGDLPGRLPLSGEVGEHLGDMAGCFVGDGVFMSLSD